MVTKRTLKNPFKNLPQNKEDCTNTISQDPTASITLNKIEGKIPLKITKSLSTQKFITSIDSGIEFQPINVKSIIKSFEESSFLQKGQKKNNENSKTAKKTINKENKCDGIKTASRIKSQKKKVSLAFKIFILMGCSWCLSFLNFSFKVTIISYLFVIVNSFQGFFLFLVLIINQKTITKISRLII